MDYKNIYQLPVDDFSKSEKLTEEQKEWEKIELLLFEIFSMYYKYEKILD